MIHVSIVSSWTLDYLFDKHTILSKEAGTQTRHTIYDDTAQKNMYICYLHTSYLLTGIIVCRARHAKNASELVSTHYRSWLTKTRRHILHEYIIDALLRLSMIFILRTNSQTGGWKSAPVWDNRPATRDLLYDTIVLSIVCCVRRPVSKITEGFVQFWAQSTPVGRVHCCWGPAKNPGWLMWALLSPLAII